jgi:hypothetical protein
MTDYIRDLRRAKWGSGVSLRGGNSEPLMSALGQKQTSDDFKAMSALLPKADIPRCSKRTSLFNHLVGGRKKRIRNSQAELSRGLEINR